MKTSFSKKINSIIFTAILILTTFMPLSICVNSNAISKVDYSLKAENCNKDRLFNVDVYVEGNTNISAVTVSISFNPSYMEFRKVKGANDAFDIQHKESDGKISAIILCSYGYGFNGKAKLMTFQFKSIKSGNTAVNARISDPVDKDLNSVPIGNVYGCKVSINGDKIKSQSAKSSSKSKSSVVGDKSVNSTENNVDEEVDSVVSEEEYQESEEFLFDEESESADLIDNTEKYPYTPYYIGGIIVIILVFLLYIAYRVGKSNNQSEKDNNDEDAEQ